MIPPLQIWRVLRFGGAMACGAGWVMAAAAAETTGASVALSPRYTGTMAIREWTEEEIGGATQRFSITQAAGSGLIYVGSGQGVIEYDGTRWRRLPSLSPELERVLAEPIQPPACAGSRTVGECSVCGRWP